jgi:hypothetical protein
MGNSGRPKAMAARSLNLKETQLSESQFFNLSEPQGKTGIIRLPGLVQLELVNQEWVLESTVIDTIYCGSPAAEPQRLFTVIDSYTRSIIGARIAPGQTLSLLRMLDRLIGQLGCPKVLRLRCDPKMLSIEYEKWASERGITLNYNPPFRPHRLARNSGDKREQ